MELTQYMETSVRESDFVILVCTPNFAQKANSGSGGVGYEKAIVTGEIFQGSAASKFIPLLRQGSEQESLPSYLKSRAYIDFRKDIAFDQSLEQLLRHLYQSPLYVRPPLGPRPRLPPSDITSSRLTKPGQQVDQISLKSGRIHRRAFILGALGTALVGAGFGYYLQRYGQTQTQSQTSLTSSTSVASPTVGLVTNGGFEDGTSAWNLGTGAYPDTTYVTDKVAYSGIKSLRLGDNAGVYQDLSTPISRAELRNFTLSYYVYFEQRRELIPSSYVDLYTTLGFFRGIAVTGFSFDGWQNRGGDYGLNFLPYRFNVPFDTWIPVSANLGDVFYRGALPDDGFAVSRIALENSNCDAQYYDEIELVAGNWTG